jgi:hypothetical protein
MWAKDVKSPKTGTFSGSKSKLELLVCFGAAKTQVWQRTEKVGPEKNIGFLVGPARNRLLMAENPREGVVKRA